MSHLSHICTGNTTFAFSSVFILIFERSTNLKDWWSISVSPHHFNKWCRWFSDHKWNGRHCYFIQHCLNFLSTTMFFLGDHLLKEITAPSFIGTIPSSWRQWALPTESTKHNPLKKKKGETDTIPFRPRNLAIALPSSDQSFILSLLSQITALAHFPTGTFAPFLGPFSTTTLA